MKILITGITGQDGRILEDILTQQGHEVHGLCRPDAHANLPPRHYAVDITDALAVADVVKGYDEIYNLAAQTHVGASFRHPAHTFMVNAIGALNVSNAAGDTPLYHASTSEMFGNSRDEHGRASETTPMIPQSPYGIAKLSAHHTMRVHRESNGWHRACGILFNHESVYRGKMFLTRKVADYIGGDAYARGPLILGELDAMRDWGCAFEFVKAMPRVLRSGKDYVLATGKSCSVRQWVEACFKAANLHIMWDGDDGYDARGILKISGGHTEFKRPMEIDCLCGNSDKAALEIGWKPKRTIDDIAYEMVTGQFLHPDVRKAV